MMLTLINFLILTMGYGLGSLYLFAGLRDAFNDEETEFLASQQLVMSGFGAVVLLLTAILQNQ